jgi:hypothetical protein
MLRILGSPRRLCDGLTRREVLTAGTLSLLAPSLVGWTESKVSARAKAVILIDTFDPKPDARAEFGTVATRHARIRFSKHVPKLARIADRFCLIRTVSHRDNS